MSDAVDADAARAEDRLLAGAAIAAVVIATTVAPTDLFPRTMQGMLLAVPAGLAATVAWSRGERSIFAPPAALAVATVVSGLLALLLGTPWVFNAAVAVTILGGWLPWPRWRTRAAARVVLWALLLAPLVVLALAQVLGWTDPLTDLVTGRRVSTASGYANLTAMSLLWAALAAEVLRRQEEQARGAWPLQAVALVLLGATGSRVMTIAAVGALAVMLWRDRHMGVRNIARRHWTWALFAVSLLPRIAGRLFVGASEGTIAGVPLSRRDVVWSTYLEEGRQFLATGGGMGRAQAISSRSADLQGLSTHNEYLWLAISVGVIGVALVAVAWFVAFRARVAWVTPRHPELLAPAALLPVMGLVEDPLLALTFVQPYLILLAAVGGVVHRPDREPSVARESDLEHRVGGRGADEVG